MVTSEQARERAETWVNGDVPAYERRSVQVREFGLGYVAWAEDREDGPTSDGGRSVLVIDRADGRATLWPALGVDEVIRRYEEEYGEPAAPDEPEPEPERPRRLDLEATSFLLSPPQWLQEAADKIGIPDRRRPQGDAGGQPAPQAPAAPLPAPGAAGTDGDGAGVTWSDAGEGGGSGAGSVTAPATVFAPPLAGSDEADAPRTSPDAKTELLPQSGGLPPTRVAPALDGGGREEPSGHGDEDGPLPDWATASGTPASGTPASGTPASGTPASGAAPSASSGAPLPPPSGLPVDATPPPGWPGPRPGDDAPTAEASGGPAGPVGYVPTQLVRSLDGPGTPAPPAPPAPGQPTPPPPAPPAPPAPPSGNDPHAAATMLASPSGQPPSGPGMPPPPPPAPPAAPGRAPVPPPPPAAGAPGTPPPPPPPGRGDPHAAATMLASPSGPPPAGPGMPPPPPAAPGGGGYGYPQPPQGVPVVGPGYMAVLRYRANDGSEQQIIRRSAPGTPHPEWQILRELGSLGVPAQQVLELHTELESCDLPGGYCARMVRETWPQVRVSHTAPYGRDHASRQQGVQHLLTHQGELAQVADGPARPRPQRVPLPHPQQVQPAAPIPLDAIGHELAQSFGPQHVFRFDQRAVARQGVPDIVAQTLVWSGLPTDFGPFFWAQAQPGRPVPTLAEIAAERGVQAAPDAASYLVMGNDFGRQLCVQYGTAYIMAVPLEAVPGAQASPTQFVNTSLPQFARCLALLGRMWRLRLGLTPDQAGRWTVDFQTQLAALDPEALASPDHWWAVLLEQMWDGLL
ncbi:SUKH-4 family immunity protein [Streptomyces sp. ICBB 8177]|uniref:SUKH-4 family immunity protein n=1 Tax=Streptomyces sp. ICBB 8177 TaxID=563922 RepID=UPI000D67A4BE|nr:SUKH-4 family immunity protein [Streptomyces sp. ICBB 8177]PWI46036.1 hypothetical protein CK485_02580 [Streptomyces sp. ICBB 8177]